MVESGQSVDEAAADLIKFVRKYREEEAMGIQTLPSMDPVSG